MTGSHVPDIPRLDRRRFLAMLGSAGALGAVGCSATPTTSLASVPPDHQLDEPAGVATAARPSSDLDGRTLVVIELTGGNDGLATLQPLEDGRLRSLRPELLAADADLLAAGSGFGWHPNLRRMQEIGLAGVVGIGSFTPDFSHFEMEQRWWRGESGERSRASTGFFGRLCDQLDVGAPVTGLSTGGGPTPALRSEKAVTVGLTDPGAHWFFREDEPALASFRAALEAMAVPAASDGPARRAARNGLDDTIRFAESIARIDEDGDDRYPWTDLGQQLRFASQVIQLDAGVRIVHARLGDFDTHTAQAWRHPELLHELDEAVSVFVEDLREQGRLDSTLVLTTSEFGRRAEQNDGGTDHGGASTMLVCGTGMDGIHGDAPDLGALDDGNLVATARFEDYYATIAEDWFGVPASEVLPAGGEPITGLLA